MEDKGPLIIIVCWTFTAIALLFVALRLYVRIHIQRKLQSDDGWILLGTLCAVMSNAFVTVSVHWGNGKHFDTLTLEQKENTIRWMMAAYVPGIETLGFPKLGIIVLLTRLLSPGRLHTVILWVMGVTCCLSLTAMVTALILQCSPPRALWTLTMPHNCLNPDVLVGLAFWASTMSAFLDFYLAVYPAVVLSKLKLANHKKVALCTVLGMGVISGCVGIKKATGVPTLRSLDVSYDLCDPLYWTSIEGNLVIVAACIPILQPLFEMAKGRVPSSSARKRSRSNKNDATDQSDGGQHVELRSNPKKVDDFGFTVLGRGADDNSQESINRPETDKASPHETVGVAPDDHNPGGITKTTQFIMEYSQTAEPAEPKRWAAI